MTLEAMTRWSALAHLSVILNLFTLIFGLLAAGGLAIWFRRRAPLVAFHALQSFFFQLFFWAGGWLLAVAAFSLARAVQEPSAIGVCLGPLAFFFLLLPLGCIFVGLLVAWRVQNGDDVQYPLIGRLAQAIIDRLA